MVKFLIILLFLIQPFVGSTGVYIEPIELSEGFFISHGASSTKFKESIKNKSNTETKLLFKKEINYLLYSLAKESDLLVSHEKATEEDLFLKIVVNNIFTYSSTVIGASKDVVVNRYHKIKVNAVLSFENYLGEKVKKDSAIVLYKSYYGTLDKISDNNELYDNYFIQSIHAILFAESYLSLLKKSFKNSYVDQVETESLLISKFNEGEISDSILLNSSYTVKGDGYYMTAYILDSTGHFLIDSRLFSKSDSVELYGIAGDTVAGVLIRENKLLHIAFGKVISQQLVKSNIIKDVEVDLFLGQEYFSFSTFSRNLGQSFSKGKVVQINDVNKNKGFKTNLFYQLGCSGSCLFNEDYNLIGIAIIENIDYRNNPIFKCYSISFVLNSMKIDL